MKVSILAAVTVFTLALYPLLSLSKTDVSDVIELNSGNTMVLNTQFDGPSVTSIIEKSKDLDAKFWTKSKPLYLFLNTPGGQIQSGLEMIESLRGLGRPVHTITMFAASMGFQTVQQLGDRLILENGILMSHSAAGEFQGSFGGEEPSQFTNRMHVWLQRTKEMDEQTVRRTHGKQTLASYQHQYSRESWLTGQEAVEQGYADKVVTVKCDKTLDGTDELNASVMGIELTYELSKCPLNSSPTNIRVKMETTQGTMTETEFLVQKGQFGADCLINSGKNKLCATDTSLNASKIRTLKELFVQNYTNGRNRVENR